MAKATNRNAIQLAIFIAFGGFLFGYDIGVISGCLIMPDFIRRFGEIDANGEYFLSSSRRSIITSLLSAGTFVGALAQAFTSDRWGRRGSILFWSGIFTVGVVIQTATGHSMAQITGGRFVTGLGVGALSAIVPLYDGETAPKALRGTLLVLYQLQIIIGLFLSYVIDLATHTIAGSASWRVSVGLQLAWGLIMLSGILFLPESPRHLLFTGRREEAARVVATLNGVPADDLLVDELVGELEFSIAAENDQGKANGAKGGKRNGTASSKSKAMVKSEDEGDYGRSEDEGDYGRSASGAEDNGGSSSKKAAGSPPPAKNTKKDAEGDEAKDDPDSVKVRGWRHKLQKTFLSGKAPPKDEDMPDLDKLFRTVEDCENITVEQLQFSKIGKVMRHIAALTEPQVPRDTEYKFRERAKALFERWQGILSASETAGGAPTPGRGKANGSSSSPGKDTTHDNENKSIKKAAINSNGKDADMIDDTIPPQGSTATETAKDVDMAEG